MLIHDIEIQNIGIKYREKNPKIFIDIYNIGAVSLIPRINCCCIKLLIIILLTIIKLNLT